MEARLKEIEIREEVPFENCKLGRRKNAKILTEFVKQYTNGSEYERSSQMVCITYSVWIWGI